MTYSSSSNIDSSMSNRSFEMADDNFMESLSPEIIAEQERIMKEIEKENAKGDMTVIQNNLPPEITAEQERIMIQIEEKKSRRSHMVGTKNMERQELSIRHAVFC